MTDTRAASTEDAELRALVEEALGASYELEQEIGRGGMGIVYRARDKRLKRLVAIKLLPPELSFRRDVRSRFLREAETAAQLGHPSIVPIYSVDEVGSLVFFVMAYVEGDNLARRVADRGPLPIADVRRWMQEVGEALAYAHARGVVHRDIKPDNILLDGIDGRAIVTDFGIARAATESGDLSRLTATGMAIGTPAYMSPEQASGDRDLDARSDLYSLGVVAYQMLCGEPPFTGLSTPALLVKHLSETPVPIAQRRADVPPELATIVMRLLEKQPEHRFQRATELVEAVRSGVVPPPVADFMLPAPYQPPAYSDRTQQQPAASISSAANTGLRSGPRSGQRAEDWSPRPDLRAPAPAPETGLSPSEYRPNADDLARWEHPRVARLRRHVATYLFVNIPITLASLVRGHGMSEITVIWTVVLGFLYAKVWAEGFDWRDVLRQPRYRLFGEVLSDLGDTLHATFSKKRREELRALGRLRSGLDGALRPTPRAIAAPGTLATPPAAIVLDGPLQALLDGARADREEIVRLLATLPASEKAQLPDLAAMAAHLVATAEGVAAGLARRPAVDSGALTRIDEEITTLEAQANPLDVAGSDARVRRLAQLRRDRRAHADATARADTHQRQLEECRLALESIRLDLVRLRTGGGSVQGLTQIAEQAMAMAREVDIVVQSARDVRDVVRPTAPSFR